MFANIKTVTFQGIDASIVDTQVQISKGLCCFNIVGLPDKVVAESKERIRSAFSAIGLSFPDGRITVNLAPADLQKEGSHFDLPITLGIMCCMGIISEDDIAHFIAIGELSLDGSISKVAGALPTAILASALNMGLICPFQSGGEAAWASDIEIIAPKSLIALLNHFKGTQILDHPKPVLESDSSQDDTNASFSSKCFSDVKGQFMAKRALEIAAHGGHHVLMIGQPGSGKSMLASRLITILPDLSPQESLELTMIYSIAGEIKNGLITKRPFRDPHYNASLVSIVGGGMKAKPGELSLAHRGVLFLDELPEFQRQTIESLRQPLETGYVIVARANSHIKYPAKPQIIAAMNPCKCGYFGDPMRECGRTNKCQKEYLSKLSGPLIERIDIQIDVPKVEFKDLVSSEAHPTSKKIKEKITSSRKFQKQRMIKNGFPDNLLNYELPNQLLKDSSNITSTAEKFLNDYANKKNISARSYFKIIKIARSVADLAHSDTISDIHLKEAIGYKLM